MKLNWLLRYFLTFFFTLTSSSCMEYYQNDADYLPILTESISLEEKIILGCDPPYASDSIWNLPIDWRNARIHPQSNQMMESFFDGEAWVGSDTSQYAPNIYYVSNDIELVPVKLWNHRSFRDAITDIEIRYGEQGGVVLVPVPLGAQPAPGTDGEMVILNTDTGEEWGMIKANKDITTGSWTAGGVYRYHIANSGIPPIGFAHRGAGIGSFAGIVRPCEIEKGFIGHAVTIAYDSPCSPDTCRSSGLKPVIPPFTKTDGIGLSKFDIPEGARLAIKPEISQEEIYTACSGVEGCILWVLNMQEYGGFVVDNSGHPKTYAEGNITADWDPAIWSPTMLKNIPSGWYVVLDWNYPIISVP